MIRRMALLLAAASVILLADGRPVAAAPPAVWPAAPVRVAVIGDYGTGQAAEAAVAALVAGWSPELVLTTGDNNYPNGSAASIDANIGQYYHHFIYPYTGSYGPGAAVNRFFPVLGNHDWNTAGAQPYLDYFALPGNERYYDFAWGPLHIFALDSDPHEPDGISATSTQALWLKAALAGSTAPWKLVLLHHPPYSSSAAHGSTPALQWPFAAWGATAVLAGHDHSYERLVRDGLIYIVNGSGGQDLYPASEPLPGSQVQYAAEHGALLIEASPTNLTFQFINVEGVVVDDYVLKPQAALERVHYLPLLLVPYH